MNKILNISLLLLLVIFISFRVTTACSEIERAGQNTPFSDLPRTYTGTLPCADCPGNLYHFQIMEDSFIELSWYLDLDSGPAEETGSWDFRGDTLFAYRDQDQNKEEPYKVFLYEDDQLTLLDSDRQRITGDLAGQYILYRMESEESIRSRYAEFKEEGIDFIASGNEPFWSVRTDFEGSLLYITPEDTISASAPAVKEYTNAVTITAETGSDSVTVEAEKTYCMDTMSGFLFTHTVTAEVNGKTITGCGMYLE